MNIRNNGKIFCLSPEKFVEGPWERYIGEHQLRKLPFQLEQSWFICFLPEKIDGIAKTSPNRLTPEQIRPIRFPIWR